jgi:serine protease SohB
VPYGQRRTLMQRLGAQLGGAALGQVEDRALWSRYGL